MRDEVIGRRLEGYREEDLWQDLSRAPVLVFAVVGKGLTLECAAERVGLWDEFVRPKRQKRIVERQRDGSDPWGKRACKSSGSDEGIASRRLRDARARGEEIAVGVQHQYRIIRGRK